MVQEVCRHVSFD
jgi:hypothetical protein